MDGRMKDVDYEQYSTLVGGASPRRGSIQMETAQTRSFSLDSWLLKQDPLRCNPSQVIKSAGMQIRHRAWNSSGCN